MGLLHREMREGHTLKRMRLGFAIALVLSLVLTACSSGGKTTEKPADNTQSQGTQQKAAEAGPTGTLKYYLVDKPTTFDPAMVSDVSTNQIIQNVFAGLVTFNEKGDIVLDLAKEYKVSEDGLTYTFTLKDAKFSDGTPVTAADFKRSILRNFNPEVGASIGESYLDDIAGVAKFLKTKNDLNAELKDKKISDADFKSKLTAAFEALKNDPSITVKDDKTLVLTIDAPKPFFLAKLTYPTAFVVGKSVPDNAPLGAAPDNVKKMIGAGPFIMDSYEEGSKVVLKANPNYVGDKAKVAVVEMPVITSDQAQLAAYRAGQIDISPVPPGDYKTLKADPQLGKEIVEWASARINYFALNQDKLEAAKNHDFRLAIAYAIDKEKLNEVVFSGTHFPAYGVLPDSIGGANGKNIKAIKFDPAKAKEHLKKSGFEGKADFTITYRAQNETSERLAQFIQSQLQTNLGIKVTLAPMEWGALLAATQKKTELEAFTLGWSADYMDPQNFLSLLLRTNAPYNRYGYSNPEFDKIVDKADVMKPGPERFAEYSKAEQIAVDDVAWIPTTYPKSMFLVRSNIKGFKYNAMGILPLNYIEVGK